MRINLKNVTLLVQDYYSPTWKDQKTYLRKRCSYYASKSVFRL